ncbi:F-box domain protein [Kalmanozyma brasiliensis GHG001]|uniref:F-box domain-containing protein n=1 Tax=Kalmanozyma brasiliensis (strain GHG001) TaxID=1365824 RepID=V5ES02_KALBG|nr:F-box domain protein [Kalmanozyma brasiliensis GHG001]EST04644.1 F-box domain protein [Kalmanozyma brasiliensis GHG001]
MNEMQDGDTSELGRAGILSLPTELIHAILLSLPPLCIEHFSQTCKLAREHVYGESRIGDMHLWKQLYLQRFDDFPSLWDAGNDSSLQQLLEQHEEENEQKARSSSSSASQTSSSVAHTPTKSAASSVMSLVQLRDRAARLYGSDPTNSGPISLNFNAVITALLSVIDTSAPTDTPRECLNTIWLSDSILSSGQNTWAEWVFPRSMLHNLDEYKIESAQAAANQPKSQQDSKRRRLSSASRSTEKQQDDGGPSSASASAGPSRRKSSSRNNSERPDTGRRRSARLLKLMYPESLHGLVDQGIDIDEIAQPQMRLAARIHCLYGIRAWKDSQKSRLTESPQEIPGQRQQDGLANEGAAQASAQEASASTERSQEAEQSGTHGQETDAAAQTADTRGREQEAADEEGDDDDDDESFDEPPAAILRYRPRTFGPSFGFCNAPDEEDEVRARMRHRVYDAGYYGWSNGYGPLHAWRRPAQPEAHIEEENEEEDDDVDMTDAVMGHGSQDGDDDAFREAAGLSDDEIPDDPVPIEIEVGRVGGSSRTFQVADRFGNPVSPEQDNEQSGAEGWDTPHEPTPYNPDTAVLIGSSATRTDRALDQPPDLGTYDEETRTYTYEGSLPVGIRTGSDNIQVTVGDTVDFVAAGELNLRFIRPGLPAQTMRVTSGYPRSAAGNTGEEEEDEEEEDDDYDEDAEDWDDEDGADDMDDLFRPPFFGTFRPMEAAEGYRGCRADDEVKQLVEQADEDQKHVEPEERKMCLRPKAIHWELVEAIMLVMYANLKEAIWLENWGVGIKIPKVFDDSGLLVRDPMEKREFLEFPTGWISSLPVPLHSKLNVETAGPPGSPPRSPPRTKEQDDEKPHDWARCESFWAGTYAFLDYSHFVDFNVRMARRRRQAITNSQAQKDSSNGKGSSHNGHNNEVPKPNLVGQEEAVGDCLQLRLELLPKSQQPEYNKNEEGQDDDDDYPTLFFRGTTVTYWGNEAPMPRGGVHGKVRPVYAREEDIDEVMSKGPRGKKKIEGLHWSLTHVYEGEDRWQLEGIQPGPPGTRAPIFGIWTDALHEEESPNGPFVYWMMDDRPWKEIERINRQDAHAAAAARAAR